MSRKILLFLFMLLPLTVNAEVIGGIHYRLGVYYNSDDNTYYPVATVISNPNNKYSGHISIPFSVKCDGCYYTVTDIDDAFIGCEDLLSVSLPNSISYIGSFKGCNSLTSINIPNSVTLIYPETFSGCI